MEMDDSCVNIRCTYRSFITYRIIMAERNNETTNKYRKFQHQNPELANSLRLQQSTLFESAKNSL